MLRKLKLILILLILPAVLSSCTTDSKEIDDQVYTVMFGCDKGTDNKLKLTVQYPVYKGGGGGSPQSGGGGGGSPEDKENGIIGNTVVQTVEASSILDGLNLMNASTTRKISLVQTKAIVFSEDLAREGVNDYLQAIARYRETRRIMHIIVCRGTAQDFIKENKTSIGESTSKAMELAFSQSDNTGYFPRSPFQEFYTNVISPYSQPITIYAGINDYKHLKQNGEASEPFKTQLNLKPGEIPRVGDRKLELLGAAVFNGDKMVGSLNPYETRYLMMVKNTFKKGIFTIKDKKSKQDAIPLEIRLGRRTKINSYFKGNIPVINVKINIEADVGAIQSQYPYEKLKNIESLNKQLEDVIKKGTEDLIKKTQTEWNTDIFYFGKKVAKNFFTTTSFENYNWLNHFKDAEIHVEVTANVRRTGLMMEASKVLYSK